VEKQQKLVDGLLVVDRIEKSKSCAGDFRRRRMISRRLSGLCFNLF